MKLLSRIVAFTFLIGMLAACTTEEKTTKEMLEDETQREEIMTMISEDPEMMMEMHNHLKGSKHDMMMKDTPMVMDSEKMAKKMNMIMDRMEEDSVACMEMAELMMKNKHMKSVMLSSCEQAGMMMGKDLKSEDHMKLHRKGSM